MARRVQLDPADTGMRTFAEAGFSGSRVSRRKALPWVGTAVEQEPGDRWINFFLGDEGTCRISTSPPSTRFVVTFVPCAAPFGATINAGLALGSPIPARWRHPARA